MSKPRKASAKPAHASKAKAGTTQRKPAKRASESRNEPRERYHDTISKADAKRIVKRMAKVEDIGNRLFDAIRDLELEVNGSVGYRLSR